MREFLGVSVAYGIGMYAPVFRACIHSKCEKYRAAPFNLDAASRRNKAKHLLPLARKMCRHRTRYTVIDNERNAAHTRHSKQNGTHVAARHVDRDRSGSSRNREEDRPRECCRHSPLFHTVTPLSV